MNEQLAFFKKPDPITVIKDVKQYDIVVVGAGSPGVPCALKAAELGAKVAIVQKLKSAMAGGNFGAGVLLDKSDPYDVVRLVTLLEASADHRAKRGLIEMWANHSGEAVSWVIEQAKLAGAQVKDMGTPVHTALLKKHGFKIEFTTCVFGPKPYNTGQGMKALCKLAEERGIDIYYGTPGEQLVQDETGRVIGVIAKSPDGYIQLNGSKGVVLATGDYANNDEMMHYYMPDMDNLKRKRFGYDGDGHKMIAWVGGRMENVGHTKMAHDMDAGPASMMDSPYLRVKLNGKRFCDEALGMDLMNCYLTSKEDEGHYCQIFDRDYMEQAKRLGLGYEDFESIKKWMPEEDVEHTGVVPGLIATFKADTLEELAAKLKIKDVPAFLATVKRYNEMAADGRDVEFGVAKENLCPVLKPPFYGIHRHIRFTVSCSGMVVNERMQVVDDDDKTIEGLYAAGNLAGHFYGSTDYPLDVFGLNLGHNYTQGYVIAKEIMGEL